ncbi:MAG: OadG family protein [Pirellulaceae bacterium]|jgi:sodium pump decarboxylase gamma subunit|nr:OadG family protein [Pirellulaceae bacterium]MDP7019599.1 OadG family protein [Pirellulaceae bacterium]
MLFAEMGFQNLTDAQGVPIAITGMLVVFVALVFIAVFIHMLPRALDALGGLLPEEHAPAGDGGLAESSTPAADGELAAALSVAVHRHRQAKA